jgi:hypothetical protein
MTEENVVRGSVSAKQPVSGSTYVCVLNELLGRFVFNQTYMEDDSVVQPLISALRKELRIGIKASKADSKEEFEWWKIVESTEDAFLANVHLIVSTEADGDDFDTASIRRNINRGIQTCAAPALEFIMHRHVRQLMIESGDLEEGEDIEISLNQVGAGMPSVDSNIVMDSPPAVSGVKKKLH